MTRQINGVRRDRVRGRLPLRQAGGTLLGMFIGLILGLALAAGVAYYLSKGGAFAPAKPSPTAKDGARGPEKADQTAEASAEKGRFDFYKILPAGEDSRIRQPDVRSAEKMPDKAQEAAPQEKQQEKQLAKAEPGKGERFYLQAGSFQTPGDAENQKARLALAGWEAQVQAATLPDRSTWYRVRVGPYASVDEMNRNRSELAKRGFEVSVIRSP